MEYRKKREINISAVFTNKPPGEGTGLGLSMSFDIITKAHGGNISVVANKANLLNLKFHYLYDVIQTKEI